MRAYLFFAAKPELDIKPSSRDFNTGMTINCTLKTKVYPKNVSYEWFSCNSAKCHKEYLKLTESSSLLSLHSQPYLHRWYQCRATNAAGSANISTDVVNKQAFKSKPPFLLF